MEGSGLLSGPVSLPYVRLGKSGCPLAACSSQDCQFACVRLSPCQTALIFRKMLLMLGQSLKSVPKYSKDKAVKSLSLATYIPSWWG